MMKKTKKILAILLLTSIAIKTIPTVYAKSEVSITAAVKDTSKKPYSGTPSTDSTTYTSIEGRSTRTYTCDYGNRWLADQNARVVSVYDENNVDIIKPNFQMDLEDYPLAGTAIGMSIKERRYGVIALYQVYVKMEGKDTYDVTETTYKCKYETKESTAVSVDETEENVLDSDNRPKCKVTEKNITTTGTGVPTCPAPEDPLYCKSSGAAEYVGERTYEKTKTYSKLYEFDFEEGQTSLTANDKRDAEQIKNCLNDAAKYFADAGNYSKYTDARYNVHLSNSNDVNSTTPVALTQSRADKNPKYFSYFDNGSGKGIAQELPAGKEYRFNYEEATVDGKTVKAGRFYIQKTDPINDKNPYLSFLITYYDYHMDRTCVDRKTGKVRYIVGNGECDKNTEFPIENEMTKTTETFTFTEGGTKHLVTVNNLEEIQWHYFTALNIKSNQGIELKFEDVSKEGFRDIDCIAAMKEHFITKDDSNSGPYKYTEVIKPKGKNTNEFFVGDYYCLDKCGTADAVFTTSSMDYQRIVNDGGCAATGKEAIYTKQLFYNENTKTTGGKTKVNFNGFNFYYRPININEPFPNGTGTTSLWTEWNTKTNKNPDISKSYEEITYVASNINSSEVRKYTEKNPYTKWDNMNVNGTSQYIDGSTIQRVNSGTVYKLGCGPTNENEYLDAAKTNKNPLYIKGCDTP